jgi:hypothetical protein
MQVNRFDQSGVHLNHDKIGVPDEMLHQKGG